MAVRSEDSSHPPLTFVACVSDEKILGANLLASACLAPGSRHEVILVKNCQNAAEGLNLGIARTDTRSSSACIRMSTCRPAGTELLSSNSKRQRDNLDPSESRGFTASANL